MSAARDLLREYVQVVWTEGRIEELARFAHPEIVTHSSEELSIARGLAEVGTAIERSRASFEPYVMTIEDLVGDEPLIAWRWSVRAKLRSSLALGPELRLLAAEVEDLLWVSFGGMCFTRFAGGRVIEERNESNPLPLMRQLGVTIH